MNASLWNPAEVGASEGISWREPDHVGGRVCRLGTRGIGRFCIHRNTQLEMVVIARASTVTTQVRLPEESGSGTG
jgi:hypothetical protein